MRYFVFAVRFLVLPSQLWATVGTSLLFTINTEVIYFNIRLSIRITKLNHEIQEQWHLAPMLLYDSIHP